MKFSCLHGEMLSRELGSSDTTQLFTTARRQDTINQAQLEWVKQTESMQRTSTLSLSSGVQEYDLEANISDFLWLMSEGPTITVLDSASNTAYYAGKDDLPRHDITWMNSAWTNWRDASPGRPISWYLREQDGKTSIGIYPAPDISSGETWTIKIPYIARPTYMSISTEVPFTVALGTTSAAVIAILEPWHKALPHYAASILERMRKNYDGVQRQLQLFAAEVADYLQRHRPKGGGHITFLRRYRGERRPNRGAYDPYRWP